MSQLKALLIGFTSVIIIIILGISFYDFYPKEVEARSNVVVSFLIESDSMDDLTLIKLETILNGIPEIKCYLINKDSLLVTALIENTHEQEGFIAYRINQLDNLKVTKISHLKDVESIKSQSVLGQLISLCNVPAYPERKISKIYDDESV